MNHQVEIWKGEIISSELIFGLHNMLSHALHDGRKLIITITENGAVAPDSVEKQDKRHRKDRADLKPS